MATTSPSTDPPAPFPSPHDPALPGHRVDENLVMRARDPTTGLEKCEPGGDQGGRETPEGTILGTGGPLSQTYSGSWEHPDPPHIPYPSSVPTCAHSKMHAPSLLRRRKEAQTQEVRPHCLPPPDHMEQQGEVGGPSVPETLFHRWSLPEAWIVEGRLPQRADI